MTDIETSLIRQLCYELYKEDWLSEHTSKKDRITIIKEYYRTKIRNEIDISFEEYVEECCYNGSIYACFEEFCDWEYLDEDYIRNLLDDEKLFELYRADNQTKIYRKE